MAALVLATGILALAGTTRASIRMAALGHALMAAADSALSASASLRMACSRAGPLRGSRTLDFRVEVAPQGMAPSPQAFESTLLCQ